MAIVIIMFDLMVINCQFRMPFDCHNIVYESCVNNQQQMRTWLYKTLSEASIKKTLIKLMIE